MWRLTEVRPALPHVCFAIHYRRSKRGASTLQPRPGIAGLDAGPSAHFEASDNDAAAGERFLAHPLHQSFQTDFCSGRYSHPHDVRRKRSDKALDQPQAIETVPIAAKNRFQSHRWRRQSGGDKMRMELHARLPIETEMGTDLDDPSAAIV